MNDLAATGAQPIKSSAGLAGAGSEVDDLDCCFVVGSDDFASTALASDDFDSVLAASEPDEEKIDSKKPGFLVSCSFFGSGDESAAAVVLAAGLLLADGWLVFEAGSDLVTEDLVVSAAFLPPTPSTPSNESQCPAFFAGSGALAPVTISSDAPAVSSAVESASEASGSFTSTSSSSIGSTFFDALPPK